MKILAALLFVSCAVSTPQITSNVKEASTEKSSVDWIVNVGRLVTMDSQMRVLEPAAVAISGTKIVAIDKPEILRSRFTAKQSIDSPDSVLLPGLINTHTHAAMTLFRGFTDGLSLEEWLHTKIFPAEKAGVTPESVRAGTKLALAEMIRAGTTTYCDMYYFEEIVAEETEKAGVRGVLGQTVIGFPVADAPDVQAGLARTEEFFKQFQSSSLITPAVAPHSTYTLDGTTLVQCRSLANRYSRPLLIHLSETRAEVQDVEQRFGKTPIALAKSLGLFEGRTIAAHSVHPTTEEIALLAKHKVGVAHCPQSNMKLGSGIAPVPALLKAGVAVGLGTDGAASNDDLNLFEEIDSAAKLQKVAVLSPTAIDAKTVLRMATIEGARALGLEEQIGSIEVGKEADFLVVGSTRAGLTPQGDLYSFLAYIAKASDVHTVFVAGKILLRNGELTTINEKETVRSVQLWRERIEKALRSSSSQ